MVFSAMQDVSDGLTFIIFPPSPYCSDPSGASAPQTPAPVAPPPDFMQYCVQYNQYPYQHPAASWSDPQSGYSTPLGYGNTPPPWTEPPLDYSLWYKPEQNPMRSYWYRMNQASTSAPPNCSSEMICTVCGDKAEGYHFGAVSCAACGAFFRRSIAEQKLYHCQRRNCCVEFESFKRSGACRYCRFEKCLESGMLTLEVQAKRNRRSGDSLSSGSSGTSSSNSERTSSKRKLSVSSTIELIVNMKRDLASAATRYQDRRQAYFTDFRSSLSLQFEKFKKMMKNHSPLQKLCMEEKEAIQECKEWFGLSQDSRGYDLFLTFYIYEMIFCTIMEGGIQLDRVCLPGGTHVEITPKAVLEFLSDEQQLSKTNCLTNSLRELFFFVVRTCGKHIQASHFDETESALLFYISLYVAARPGYTGPDAGLYLNVMKEMGESMQHIGADFAVKMGGVVLSTQDTMECLAQLKEVLNFVSLHRQVRWDQPMVKMEA